MPIPGKIIYNTRDSLGEIQVYDDGLHRFLAFGTDLKQSAVNKLNSTQLIYEYSQVMALALAVPDSLNNCLIGGLGGGSLARFIAKHYPGCQIAAVDYRQAVIDVAHDHFYMPKVAQLETYAQDLDSFLKEQKKQSFYDVIYLDLFTAEGMHAQQKQLTLYEEAYRQLNSGGVLVANLAMWEMDKIQSVVERLTNISAGNLSRALVPGGNFLVFAFKPDSKQFKESSVIKRAAQLSKSCGQDLSKYLPRIA